MIVRPRQNWFRMLFVWNGSVLQSIIPQLIFMAIVSSLAVFTHGKIFGEKIPLNTAPFTLFGLALAIFLAFRNNASPSVPGSSQGRAGHFHEQTTGESIGCLVLVSIAGPAIAPTAADGYRPCLIALQSTVRSRFIAQSPDPVMVVLRALLLAFHEAAHLGGQILFQRLTVARHCSVLAALAFLEHRQLVACANGALHVHPAAMHRPAGSTPL
jgi:hypothetical protein